MLYQFCDHHASAKNFYFDDFFKIRKIGGDHGIPIFILIRLAFILIVRKFFYVFF